MAVISCQPDIVGLQHQLLRNWPKRSPILLLGKIILHAFREVRIPWPQGILFGHMPDHHITLRSA
jgi:hypothetical protein